jgi:serine/threonine protein kinase
MYQSLQGRATPIYSAPEFLLEDKFSKKSDIWSFGCIMFEHCFACLDRRRPFSSIFAITSYKSKTDIATPSISWQSVGITPDAIPMSLRPDRQAIEDDWESHNRIFAAVFHRDPAERPTATKLIEHFEGLRQENS